MDEDDKVAEIGRFIRGAAQPIKPVRRRPAAKPAGASVVVTGNGNTVAGRDVVVAQKVTVRHPRVPAPGGLTGTQQLALQAVIDELVQREVAGDTSGDAAKAKQRYYAKWYGKLKKQFGVGAYTDIPAELGESAVAWLKQQRAIKRTKLRRAAPDLWRQDAYRRIWSKARELGMSKGEVYAIAAQKLGKQVSSLKQLGEQALDSLRGILFAIKK